MPLLFENNYGMINAFVQEYQGIQKINISYILNFIEIKIRGKGNEKSKQEVLNDLPAL